MSSARPSLSPREITLTSTFKNWGGSRETGTSSGSDIEVSYTVNVAEFPDLDEIEAKRLLLVEKKRLDLFCLDTEYLRGGMDYKRYKRERAAIVERYDTVIGINECRETAGDLAG